VNQEAIFSTRPWKVFGEGPASEGAALSAQGFNEGKGKATTAADFRFTQKGDAIYAIELGWPTNAVSIKSLGKSAGLLDKPIEKIQLLGSREKIRWSQTADALAIEAPEKKTGDVAIVFKITTK
jgi:alpha-L-fucosidase